MTRTEDRLTDALHTAAGLVREDALRPLRRPATGAEGASVRPRWVAPLAAAGAVLLIAGVAATAARGNGGRGAGVIPAPPRYYVELARGPMVVRATKTGAITATLPRLRVAGRSFVASDVTSTGNGSFVAYVSVRGGDRPAVTRLYRLRLTAAGRIRSLTVVPGGTLDGVRPDSLAATPGGSRVAIAVRPAPHGSNPVAALDRILIIGTRTGSRTDWPVSVGTGNNNLAITGMSWTGSGRELAYLSTSACYRPPAHGRSASCGPLRQQVTTIRQPPGGGLSRHQVLRPHEPRGSFLTGLAISPNGSAVTTEAVGWGSRPAFDQSVQRLSARTGRPLRVIYQVRLTGSWITGPFTADPSGRWLIASVGDPYHPVSGWIHTGRLVPLQPSGYPIARIAWSP